MVTQESDENLPSPMDMKEMLAVLNNKTKCEKNRRSAYSFLSSSLASKKDVSQVLQHHTSQLFKYISRDALSQDADVLFLVLKVMEYCVKDEQFLTSVSKDDSEMLLTTLLKTGKLKHSEDITKQILFVLSQQKFSSALILTQIESILDTLEYVYTEDKNLFCIEILRVIDRMHEMITPNFGTYAPRWSLLVFPFIAHAMLPVRRKSFYLLMCYKASLVGHLELGKQVLKLIDNGLGKSLSSLVDKSPEYVMDVWSMVMDVAGKAIHKGSTINIMLEIIENGFKGSPDSRVVSFRAWRSLVNNFALDPDVITDAKRIRLLMMVFKTNNAKTESVALEKLSTWWHVVTTIGPKLSSTMEQIVYPLLQFCMGSVNQTSQQTPQSPNFALKISNSLSSKLSGIQTRIVSQQLPAFPILQKMGCQVIAHLLSRFAEGDEHLPIKWTLGALPNEVFSSPATFVKHAPFIMLSLEHLLKAVGNQIQANLILYIWRSLSNQLKVAMEKAVKVECRDIFSAFLSHFHSLVQSECIDTLSMLKLFQIIITFPNKVLSSTLFNTGVGTAVKGCPALYLCEVLFMPPLLKLSSTMEDKYLHLFSSIVRAGASNQQGALSFIQAVSNLLDSGAQGLASSDLMCRLWSILTQTLLENITATNEVNQGDSLEYNFGCLYSILLIPVSNQLASKTSQSVYKVMVRIWRELYHSFARLSALVATAEANACLEEMSSKVIGVWRPEFKDAAHLEFLSNICIKMLDCVDFSAVCAIHKQSGFTLSPSKWTKRRQRPMGNLHSFVHLLAKMQSESNSLLDQLVDRTFAQTQTNAFGSLVAFINALVDIYTRLFSHIPATIVSHVLAVLASPIARLFNSKTQTGGVKIFVPSVMTKLEKLWFEISSCITGRYTDQYDSAFLATLSPLLEVTFPHFRRTIKNQTVTLWSSTFGKSVGLVYPDDLKPVLATVKEKTAIVLPGWIGVEDQVIAETPFTEASQGESQVSVPVLPGLPSPQRQKGSFLNRDISPGRKTSPLLTKASPAKVVSPKEGKSLFTSCRNISLDLNMMSDKDFVVITSPTKKRRPLTEHQKEVLKEKRVLPVMYNNLDASQDISLMSQLNTESQQESMSCADVIVVESSETQMSQGKHKLKASDGCEDRSFSDVNKDNSVSSGFIVPKQVKSSTRRRSIRIQETTSTKDKGSNTASKNEELAEASDNSSQLSTLSKEGKNDLSDVGGEDKQVDIVVSSLDITVDSSIDMPQSTEKKSEPAAFGMFRSKNSPTTIVIKNVPSVPTGSDISSPGKSDIRPKRVSLRNLQSQGESSEVPAVIKVIDIEAKKGKSPRRVPLQRIHDQESGKVNSKNEESGKNSPKTKTAEIETRKPEKDDKSNADDLSSAVESSLKKNEVEKLSVKERLSSPRKLLRSPMRKRKFSDIEDVDIAPMESSPIIPITLVEDTQSPTRVGKTHTETASIAETPVKSDDSPSPAIRSIRKLFADDDTDVDHEKNSVINGTPKNHLVNVKSPTTIVVNYSVESEGEKKEEEVEILSQGFMPSQEKSKELVTCSNSQELFPESEILLGSCEDINSEADDMMMPMPTLSSQIQECGMSGRSDSSSGSKSSSSVESDNKEKVVSGTESEFDPSQATLRDDGNKTVSAPKKKATVTQTLASTRTRRSKVQKKEESCDQASNKIEDSGSKTPSNASVEGYSEEVARETKTVDDKAVNGEEPTDVERHKNQSHIDDCQNEDEKILVSNEGISILEKESKIKNSLEIGETTPDIKSPSENSSMQRSSTTKKRRLMAKRLSAQLGLQSVKEGPNASNSESAVDEKSGKLKRKSAKKLEGRLVSSAKRRISPAVSPVTSKHLLRMRTKAVRKLTPSPPAKRRRVLKNNMEPIDDSMDDQPLTVFISTKQTKPLGESEMKTVGDSGMSKNLWSADDLSHDYDEDKPLSLLVSKKIVLSTNSVLVGDEDQSEKIIFIEDHHQEELNVGDKMCEDVDSCQDLMEVDVVENVAEDENAVEICDAQSLGSTKESILIEENVDCMTDAMASTEEEIPPGQVAPCVELEGSDQSTGSDEVFDHGKDKGVLDAFGFDEIVDDDKESTEVTEIVEGKDETLEVNNTSDGMEIDVRSEGEKPDEIQGETTTEEIPVSKTCDDRDVDEDSLDKKKDYSDTDVKEVIEEYIPSNWSPSKSPSSSILRKSSTPNGDKGRRKVSFAEPVVSGESPVREKYHAEALPTSPLICHSNLAFTRPSSSAVKISVRGSGYRRKLEVTMKKQVHGNFRQRNVPSPTPSPSSQNTYRGTQESQLDSINPIFPDLVDCKASLDCVLPQLTSSLWYRGLCQLMKGRNLHTIGDLSALTEVQVNQMPIRCPKVDTVRDALTNYQNQHGGSSTPKSPSKSIFGNDLILEGTDTPETPGTPKSDGATIGLAVTPSSIADEGIKILPSAEHDLSQLSPIKDPSLKCNKPAPAPTLSQTVTSASSSSSVPSVSTTQQSSTSNSSPDIVSALSSLTTEDSLSQFKGLKLPQLFDVHQKLNFLFGVVVEQMKERSLQS